MQSINRFLIDVATGAFLSFTMVFVGGWYLHYLPVLTIVHAFVLGLGYALIRRGVEGWTSKKIGDCLVWGFLVLYLGVWLTQFSSLLVLTGWMKYLIAGGVLLVILGFAEGLRILLQGLLRHGQKLPWMMLVLTLVVLLLVKGFGVALIPYGTIDQLALHVNPISTQGGFLGDLRSVFYPFSVSMETGINRYSFFMDPPSTEDHVFFVVLDSLRRDVLGSRVGDLAVTPTLNEIRKEAKSYSNYYVQASWTKPSTASLFTGRYLREHGTFLTWNPPPSRDDERYYGQKLPDRFRTLAERLSEKGFSTFGAVSISHIDSSHQFDQGFDRWFNPNESFNEDYAAVQRLFFWLMRKEPKNSFSYLHMIGPHYPYKVSLYNWEYWKETPFFQEGKLRLPGERFPALGSITPNSLPWTRDQMRSEEIRYLRDLYRAKLNLWDRKIVRSLLEGLRGTGHLPGSHLIVTSDHGEELYDYRRYGHKRNMREVVLSPPLMVQGPEFSEEETSDRLVESTDLGATILDLANVGSTMNSGRSILEQKPSHQRDIAFAELGKDVVLEEEVDRESIQLKQDMIGVDLAVVRQGGWKLYQQYDPDRNVLINLQSDPGEFENVTDRIDLRGQLRDRISDALGPEGKLKTNPPPLIRAGDQQIDNLKGLGYLQ